VRFVAALLFAVTVGAQQVTPPPQSALDRATAARNARHDNTRYDAYFRKYSKRYFGIGFDWQYFKAQGMAESELSATARSNVGARGVMQLMPSTFQEIQSKRPEFQSIDDPEWNIAAGIMHDRYLWRLWEPVGPDSDRTKFMFGSYNAGEGTIGRASATAQAKQLDQSRWPNIELVAPEVPRWRYRETLGYVKKIDQNYGTLRTGGQRAAAPPPPKP
jgi:soluble lytic murein transglycosylase-like protein